jgi:hypothetical protein
MSMSMSMSMDLQYTPLLVLTYVLILGHISDTSTLLLVVVPVGLEP